MVAVEQVTGADQCLNLSVRA